jgi:hypothetical protein
MNKSDMIEIERLLRKRMGALASALLGEPVRRDGDVWRFEEILEFQGKPEVNTVLVVVSGRGRGEWYGSIYAEGIDPLDFICHYGGCNDRASAAQWAKFWLAGKLVPVPTYAPENLVGREA